MTSTTDCETLAGKLAAYMDGSIRGADAETIARHLEGCAECSATAERFSAVKNLLEYAQLETPSPSTPPTPFALTATRAQPQAPEKESALLRLGGAPWWLVSCTLHVLLIALAGLVSMAIQMPQSDDGIIMVTELQSRPVAPPEERIERPTSALASAHETPATDPTSKDASNIVVPPDILAKASLGDHFETINPELPDSHSALGNPDAQSFHAVTGNTEAAGGGGNSGLGMEDVIGIGGAASRGSGGGFGGGDGLGTGTGSGAGHGSFGNRSGGGRKLMVRRNGGSPATESAVDAALRWLAYHQEPDGSWQIKKHDGSLPESCAVGVTGLATLAFLGAGHSTRIGEYKENVRRAIDWLISQQKENGSIGLNNSASGYANGSGYNHPIAGMALAEACAMARDSRIKEAARKAVYYTLETHWDPALKIWRYGCAGADHGPDDSNMSVTAWFVMQLKSARMAGLEVDHSYFVMVSDWLDKMKKHGGDGYGLHQYEYYERDNGRVSPACTAMALVCRLFMGTPANELESGGDLLLTQVPKWSAGNGTTTAPRGACPHYYWYYGTLGMFQMGGEHWKQWNEALKSTLIPNQRKDGDFAGSWDMIGSDGPFGGRAYTTALGALSLEVYYRYAKLNDQ